MYGKLTPTQIKLLTPVVQNKDVVDIGGGSGWLSNLCDTLGGNVTCLDRMPTGQLQPKVKSVTSDMNSLAAKKLYQQADTLLLCWPVNNPTVERLLTNLPNGKTLIYIGSNHDGNACGTEDFWRKLVHNAVIGHCSDLRNHMIIYELGKKRQRPFLWEEWNGCHINTDMIQPYRAGESSHAYDATLSQRSYDMPF